jgi:hypothetical protein
MAMEISTGQMTTYDGDHSVQPLDASASPGVASVTPTVGQLPPGTIPGRDTVAEFAAVQADALAECSAAQAAGMDARNAMLGHYQAQALPLGSQVGDPVSLPLVPDASVPPAMSDLYPFPGLEPTEADAGMAGPYHGDTPQ